MNQVTVPYLSGGIFFAIISEMKNARYKIKADPVDGTTDQLSDTVVMKELLYVFTGETISVANNLLNPYVSRYKACEINDANYLDFTNPIKGDSFKRNFEMKNIHLIERMQGFIIKFISEQNYESLVKALIMVISEDELIDTKEKFYISMNEFVNKDALREVKHVELDSFLISVMCYFLDKRKDNTKGRDTFEYLYDRSNKHSAWKLKQNIIFGEPLNNSINVKLSCIEECREGAEKMEAEPVEPIIIEEKEGENAKNLQIINKSTIVNQYGEKNIHIEHLETLNL